MATQPDKQSHFPVMSEYRDVYYMEEHVFFCFWNNLNDPIVNGLLITISSVTTKNIFKAEIHKRGILILSRLKQ